jgi:hypothetical protein
MNINADEFTMAKTDEGVEYVAETFSTVSRTAEDGTEYVAEITTTANPDDPTEVESHMTVTATDEAGNETVREYVANADGTFLVEEDSDLENSLDELLGFEIDEDYTKVAEPGETLPTGSIESQNDSGYDSEAFEVAGSQFEVHQSESFGSDSAEVYQADTFADAGSFDTGFSVADTYSAGYDTTDNTTASDYLVTDTSFDVEPVETSTTAEDLAYNAQYNADYADYYQDQADIAHDTAMDYMEHGDYDAANVYMESYEEHQTAADDWATADIE